MEILNTLPGNSEYKIVLYEDIDSAFSDKEILAIESKLTEAMFEHTVVNTDANTNINSNHDPRLNHDPRSNYATPQKTNNESNTNDSNSKTVTSSSITRKYLTYSGLLNALDGILSNQKGIITIMTTNYIGKLGQALIRPGRIDKAFELSYCVHEQIVMMIQHMISIYDSFVNNEISPGYQDYLNEKIINFADRVTDYKIKPSKLQFYVLKYICNYDELFDNYFELQIKEINE